jgi:predicted alpha/beta superfamily hydrolase
VGGLAEFLQTIETEIRPQVSALMPVDPSNQVLFGHSLGGLAALHTLFMAPQAFSTFIVASPSIWWNGRAVLSGEAAFRAAVESGEATPRVLVTMGALEGQSPSHIPTPPGAPAKDVAERIARARMVENAQELTARLRTLSGKAAFEVAEYLVFPNQGHGVSAWSALAAGVAFGFQGAGK